MLYVIYKLSNPNVYLESHDSSGGYTTTTDVDLAETFSSATAAQSVIDNIPDGNEFLGHKPKPPKE